MSLNFIPGAKPGDQRQAQIRAFVDAAKALDYTVLSDYPVGLMDWVPPVADGWTVRQHIVHVVDADIHAHARIGFALAEPGTTITVWDEGAWKENLDYTHQSATVSLQLLRLLRSIIGARLTSVDAETWKAAQCIHPDRGVLTLDDILAIYTGHISTHLDYIKRNEKLWAEADPTTLTGPACG